MKQAVVTFTTGEQMAFAHVAQVKYEGTFVVITELGGKRTGFPAHVVLRVVETGTRTNLAEDT